MTFTTFDAVLLTAAFLVPGFVWSAVLSMLVPRRASTRELRVLEFLTLSCLNNGFWSWLVFLLIYLGMAEWGPYWTALIAFGIIFVSPILLGVISGRLYQTQGIGRLLRRLGFRTIDPVPTAWDWHFSQAKPYWATVTLKNGSRVLGLFGTRSFAGDEPQGRDLFLEATYRLLPNGEWAPVEDTAGALIMPDQIAVIEFRTVEVIHGEGKGNGTPQD